VLAMLPAAFVFLMKINLHPWMDKNDVSHILLSIGNVFFYVGIIKVTPELSAKFNAEFEGYNTWISFFKKLFSTLSSRYKFQ
jgi:hypothetical protein